MRFYGTCPPQQVCSVLCQSDIYVSTSLGETAGYAVVEAALHELPLVATPTGWAARLVQHGNTGFRIPPKDPQAVAEAVTMVARRSAMMGRLARRRAETVIPSWTQTGRLHIELYRMLIGNRS